LVGIVLALAIHFTILVTAKFNTTAAK